MVLYKPAGIPYYKRKSLLYNRLPTKNATLICASALDEKTTNLRLTEPDLDIFETFTRHKF